MELAGTDGTAERTSAGHGGDTLNRQAEAERGSAKTHMAAAEWRARKRTGGWQVGRWLAGWLAGRTSSWEEETTTTKKSAFIERRKKEGRKGGGNHFDNHNTTCGNAMPPPPSTVGEYPFILTIAMPPVAWMDGDIDRLSLIWLSLDSLLCRWKRTTINRS